MNQPLTPEQQDAKIAAMQAALAKGGHAENCNLSHNHGPECPECRVAVCNCHLATLSDDIERGKELLGAMKELADGHAAYQRLCDSMATVAEENQRQAVEIEELRKDREILDWLELRRVGLNKHCGSSYGWKFVASHNVNRLYVRDLNTLDLNDVGPAGGDIRSVVHAAMKEKP